MPEAFRIRWRYNPDMSGIANIRAHIDIVDIPNTVLQIPADAFANAPRLTTVNTHSEITHIGNRAFFGTALEHITIPSAVVPTVSLLSTEFITQSRG